ncbi:MAG: isoaspartyl peptidase/L-asparaginase [Candidatus Sericytochromatia bacterium]|nr:isoaspartyl peptidase/L-asparaginase [Candidatus Tanganyikabacteria bacterium]
MPAWIATHGGAAAPAAFSDGCLAAARRGREMLDAGAPALDAAVAAVRLLEDDGRFNAGSGSVLRMDGVSIEMDAALMDTRGRLASVAAVYDVKNPILLALEVSRTPHVMLVGEGAVAFARKRGFPEHRHMPSERAVRIYREICAQLRDRDFSDMPAWEAFDLVANWNFARGPDDALAACDTVGAVCCDLEGHLAVASSTGGAAPMLRGRVGDTPIVGSGFFAGEHGAVAATGLGEEIIRQTLALRVYERLAAGLSAQEACEWGVARFPPAVDVGVIAATRAGTGIASNRDMPRAAL